MQSHLVPKKYVGFIVRFINEFQLRNDYKIELIVCCLSFTLSIFAFLEFTKKDYIPENILVIMLGFCPSAIVLWDSYSSKDYYYLPTINRKNKYIHCNNPYRYKDTLNSTIKKIRKQTMDAVKIATGAVRKRNINNNGINNETRINNETGNNNENDIKYNNQEVIIVNYDCVNNNNNRKMTCNVNDKQNKDIGQMC